MWKVAEFGGLVGVSPSTLRRWESEGKLIPERTLGNQRVYTEAHLSVARNLKTGKSATRVIVYCRVSSNGQKDDLASQVKAMEQFCLSRQHLRLSNIRQDTTQKMTTDLSRKVYNIRIEDLNVSGLIANHKLAAAVSNNCFHEIRRQLIYKQAHYGTKVELVDRWYASSKTCSQCGHVQDMKLSDRLFNCQKCGHSQDRDENASVNLENAPDDKVRSA